MGTYTCDPSDQEAEVGRWPQVQGQPQHMSFRLAWARDPGL